MLGEGTQLVSRSVIGAFSSIGGQSIVNTTASIDHDCEIGRAVHVKGDAALASYVTVGDFSSMGTNATGWTPLFDPLHVTP